MKLILEYVFVQMEEDKFVLNENSSLSFSRVIIYKAKYIDKTVYK